MAECFNVQQQIQLRYLCPDDLLEVKQLCADWFPIQYPESWYTDILTNPRFYSLAATINLKIIGMIVSEVKPKIRCNREDSDILAAYYPSNTLVAYILSLGVVKQYRRLGIASLLLDNLLSYLTSEDLNDCKVVYLHVLTTNSIAIRFYEKRNFTIHASLPYYYSIKGKLYDGYSYVLYINDGKPPSTLLYPFFYWIPFT
ncbi:hypothetical protein HELRODRAFT_64313 [Helobdella robusta]|uniref:N-alpha-acetyltransferase 60 n=1 Tax=Helobdella robusta TaxID=6412 RepID=T1FXS6_HELRO|nr:hypothetical protein HELRODRAFT_64313 [Helobdella robusta]ESO06678.1 hypothetical protein HELRODRAFT_64313 [Helobdella robusta]